MSVGEETGKRWSRRTTPGGGPDNAHSNPCHAEAQMSMRCLEDTGYDRDKCETHFDNYKECKKFWNGVRDARARKGVVPHMPPFEEREAIKKRYMETGKLTV